MARRGVLHARAGCHHALPALLGKRLEESIAGSDPGLVLGRRPKQTVSSIPGEVEEMAGATLGDHLGWDRRLEEVCRPMMDAAWSSAGELGQVVGQAVATRQPDLEAPLHQWGDGLAADESRSSGDKDASHHDGEPGTT
jgi:hypothetical protein